MNHGGEIHADRQRHQNGETEQCADTQCCFQTVAAVSETREIWANNRPPGSAHDAVGIDIKRLAPPQDARGKKAPAPYCENQ